MDNILRRLAGSAIIAVALPTIMGATACAPLPSPPVQVSARNPSVTYTYRGDEELIQANQRAAAFCLPYHSIPNATRITNTPDGGKSAIFECLQAPPSVAFQTPYNPNVSFSYQTDQQLLDATRNARIYCLNNGSSGLTTNTNINASGVRTAAFQCTAG
jgi:hypothetical protein